MWCRCRPWLPPLLLLSMLTTASVGAEEARTKARPLFTFEVPAEVATLTLMDGGTTLGVVQDVGVSEGKNCLRLVVAKGGDYGGFTLPAKALTGWAEYDYLAVDVATDDEHSYPLVIELLDADSKSYPSRCTFEHLSTRRGRQTLLYPINRARRNRAEGREWAELLPQDKIALDALTTVKLFLQSRKDRDAVVWLDNIRLLQEDAAKPKLTVKLPPTAKAFKFASVGVTSPGFITVPPGVGYTPNRSYGYEGSTKLQHGGDGWPDLLAGTFVTAPPTEQLRFRLDLPEGEYLVWLAAGKIIKPATCCERFLLALNDTVLCDERPSFDDFCSEKFLYRFLRTQYSEKPHALWTNYLDRMYPTTTAKVRVGSAGLTVQAMNHFVGALVVAPVAAKDEFEAFTVEVRQTRLDAFEATCFPLTQPKPKPANKDEWFIFYVPDLGREVRPWTGPTAEERSNSATLAGAPGQRVVLRLALTPFYDFGRCSLQVSDLRGPDTIPAKQITGHFQNYRHDGRDLSEMALIPSLTLDVEAGVTQCFWLWLQIPETAKPGVYKGLATFKSEKRWARPLSVPVELEVYPFTLEPVLPVSFGFYHGEPAEPPLPPTERRRLLKEQFEWLRTLGCTAINVGAPTVLGVNDTGVSLRFDTTAAEVAKEVGMGRHALQFQMGSTLGLARAIGRRLPGSRGALVDQHPGIELRQPLFKGVFLDALHQYREALAATGLPVAVEIVDEPRETPNPWNRNLADTLTYAGFVREAGLTGFVSPMADHNAGKDYTGLVEQADIISTHGWKHSAELLRKTRAQGKPLWLYNTGVDRFSWGFYAYRARAAGRWEWHLCASEDAAVGGYPGRDWYNPFTSAHGLAPQAPPTVHGGRLYRSSLLDVAEGMSDYAYLHTLQTALEAHKKAGTHPKTVAEAEAFLTALARVIPEFPDVKGVVTEADGALVGLGIQDDARLSVDRWRRTIAGYLKVLRP